jgi:hypothetical protein
MIIDSQFTITRYDGKGDLPLSSGTPAGIPVGSTEETKYKRFIKSVKAIYGSQKQDETIPIFFKNTDNTISTNSTLTKLESDRSYYIISHMFDPVSGTKTVFPYAIPNISGVLDFPAIVRCPILDNTDSVINLNTQNNNSTTLSTVISNLTIGVEYSYSFESESSNWPCNVYPRSGTFITDSESTTLTTLFYFDNDLACTDCFDYSSSGVAFSSDIHDTKFNILKLNVYPDDTVCSAGTSKLINIYCHDCLVQPTPTITPTPTKTPAVTPTTTPTPTPTPSNYPSYDTTLTITGSTTSSGESSNGITFQANNGDSLSFKASAIGGAPIIMRIIISSVQVAQVTFESSYVGNYFSFTKSSLGAQYTGVFKSGDVILG